MGILKKGTHERDLDVTSDLSYPRRESGPMGKHIVGSLIGRIIDRLSDGTGSIPGLVSRFFLVNLSYLSSHTHVDTFLLVVGHIPRQGVYVNWAYRQ
jgi:hypothetical protein